jgi:predicted membrane protein
MKTRTVLGVVIILLGLSGLLKAFGFVGSLIPGIISRQFVPAVFLIIGISLLARHRHKVIGIACTAVGALSFMGANRLWGIFSFGNIFGCAALIVLGVYLIRKPKQRDEDGGV